MKQCLKCNDVIPSRIWIDGKIRNIKSRKFCIKCSPFGKHNTSKNPIDAAALHCCKTCKREYFYDRSKGHSKIQCNSCNIKARRFKVKEKAINYKGGKCEKCGYNKCIKALDFHHVDSENKVFDISILISSISWEIIKIELDKCKLLCCRCHREIHYLDID